VDERTIHAAAAGLGAVAEKRKRLVKILGYGDSWEESVMRALYFELCTLSFVLCSLSFELCALFKEQSSKY